MPYKTNLIARDFLALAEPTGNLYEAVAIISKRARQIAVRTKEELDNKLAEVISEDIEAQETDKGDIQEQVAINRRYESMPKPTTTATEEFLGHKLMYRYPEPAEM